MKKYVFILLGFILGVLTLPTAHAISDLTLELRAEADEHGTEIVFWEHPTSTDPTKRIAQITAHGTAVGSGDNEMAFYTTRADGSWNNRFKLLADVDTTPLILTGATGISRTSGLPISIGTPVLGGGASKVIIDGALQITDVTLDTTCKKGQISFDDKYLYLCVLDGQIKKASLKW